MIDFRTLKMLACWSLIIFMISVTCRLTVEMRSRGLENSRHIGETNPLHSKVKIPNSNIIESKFEPKEMRINHVTYLMSLTENNLLEWIWMIVSARGFFTSLQKLMKLLSETSQHWYSFFMFRKCWDHRVPWSPCNWSCSKFRSLQKAAYICLAL